MELFHYYDKSIGPFVNLSEISLDEAKKVMNDIKQKKPDVQCAKRHNQYLEDRLYYEKLIRELFLEKNGKVERIAPHYMVVEHCPWLSTWYENSAYIKIPVEEFDLETISFTYGDSHPTFSPRINDNKEYRKKLYNYHEILGIIEKYGLPQDWNRDGRYGPERYIEAQIWSDEVISRYK
jgi:hypothetical protein